jgi:hypothetical protein
MYNVYYGHDKHTFWDCTIQMFVYIVMNIHYEYYQHIFKGLM